jgi:hypothetical protein
LHMVLLQKHGRIATLDCYEWTLIGQNDFFKMVWVLWKWEWDIFGKWVKNWVDGMDVCVRRMGELVPVWLSMLELSISSLRTVLRDISLGPIYRTTTRPLYVATA